MRVDFPTFGRPTNPIDRSFFTRPNLAARMAPRSSSTFFLGGMVLCWLGLFGNVGCNVLFRVEDRELSSWRPQIFPTSFEP